MMTLYCTIKTNNDNFAFTLVNTSEIDKINNSNTMKFCEFIPSFECIAETDKFTKFQLNVNENEDDFEENIPSLLDSKYYSVNSFQKLNNNNNLNIFHSNVNGLDSKFDSLNNFLAETKSDLDIIAITETSEQSENSFLSNVSIEGYSLFHTPTNSSKGGTALYVNSNYNPFERFDLKFQGDMFESVWTEISNKSSKNVLCGCIYRHSKYDVRFFRVHGIYFENSG